MKGRHWSLGFSCDFSDWQWGWGSAFSFLGIWTTAAGPFVVTITLSDELRARVAEWIQWSSSLFAIEVK